MKEILNYLVQFYKWLDKFPCQLKTIVIITLIGFIFIISANNNIKNFIEKKYNSEKELLVKQESYLERVAPQINELIENIIMRDSCMSNVILLNYHNSLISSNGLAYKHLTAISEKFRGMDNYPCIDYWQGLDYVNFIDEIQKINQNDFTIIELQDVTNKVRFPNIWYKLKKCECKYAVLYPIRGTSEAIGMLIVIYKDCMPNIDLKYCHDIIYPGLHKLSILLDFNNLKMNYED